MIGEPQKGDASADKTKEGDGENSDSNNSSSDSDDNDNVDGTEGMEGVDNQNEAGGGVGDQEEGDITGGGNAADNDVGDGAIEPVKEQGTQAVRRSPRKQAEPKRRLERAISPNTEVQENPSEEIPRVATRSKVQAVGTANPKLKSGLFYFYF